MQAIPVHLLNALVVFGRSTSVADAAEKLGITQPALSKQLKALEEEMPQPLFAYSGRSKVLTPFGRDLLVALSARLNDLDQIVTQVITSHANEDQARLRIIGRRGVLDRLSQNLEFRGFIEFAEGSNAQVLEDLRSRKADIGIAYSHPDTHELVSKPLFREKFSLVVPKRLKIPQRTLGKRLFADLVEFPCLGFKTNDEILSRLCQVYSVSPQKLKMVRAMADYVSLGKMVEAGLGWAVLPSYLEFNHHATWQTPLPPDTFAQREFFLLYRTELAQIPWFKAVINSMITTFRS